MVHGSAYICWTSSCCAQGGCGPGHRRGHGRHGTPATSLAALAVTLRRRAAKESVTAIAGHLSVGRSTLCCTLAAFDARHHTSGAASAVACCLACRQVSPQPVTGCGDRDQESRG
ncbi:hypothetical protein SSAG_01054 [Streptomyces sp. Mg1]|nr:hypothetical protein SSAG_01054 [Streptomyces sp. Mg1]